MVYYDSSAIYISSATSLKDKVNRVDAVITALLDTAAKAAANDDITEYSLDNGQTKIRTQYKGTDAVYKSIESFEKLKQVYLNQLNGRVFRLMDGKNFRRNG